MSEKQTSSGNTFVYVCLSIIAVCSLVMYAHHITQSDPNNEVRGDKKQEEVLVSENVIYSSVDIHHPFCDISAVEKCVVQITTGNFKAQGIIYARRDNDLYIALPKHCLPNTKDWIISIKTTHQRIDWESYESWSNNVEDAAMLILHGVIYSKSILTISELGLIADRAVVGDTVYAITPFDPRNVRKKIGRLRRDRERGVDYTPYRTETGDSGSPTVGRFGIIGINCAISLEEGAGIFCPIKYFESLYISATTPNS